MRSMARISVNSYRNIWASADSKPPSRTRYAAVLASRCVVVQKLWLVHSKSSRGQRRKRVPMLRRMSTSALMQAKQKYKHVDVPSSSTPTHRRLVVRRRSTRPLYVVLAGVSVGLFVVHSESLAQSRSTANQVCPCTAARHVRTSGKMH